ncbi:hypothetical protein SAMN04490182_2470 [Pseudomonas cedrina]|uniref:Uncharacterized protein n=1 Tax=Pseudomonas cedrina TaxID=651740 RepID=A0ABY0UKA7_PSECE|nr:hypothetical protein [Pseudomonas cedrina]SDS81513.1 hypothetical protein SAMN04490182_2470 [Pseudomonas cedrina]
MTSFYHIYLRAKKGVTAAQIEEKINLSLDWYKYAPCCWVVKSTSEVEKWQTRLRPLVDPDGVLLILKIDTSERQGWIAKGFWDWYKKSQNGES